MDTVRTKGDAARTRHWPDMGTSLMYCSVLLYCQPDKPLQLAPFIFIYIFLQSIFTVIERADSSCDSDGSSGEGESEVDAQAEVWNVVGQTEGDVHRWLDPTAINGASRYTYRIKALGSATSDQRSFTQELDICNAPTKVIQVKEEEEEGEEEEEEEEEEVKRVPDSSGAVGTVSGRLAVAVVLALSAM